MIEATLASLVFFDYMTKDEADIISARLHDQKPPHWRIRPSDMVEAIEGELHNLRYERKPPSPDEAYADLTERLEGRRNSRTFFEKIFGA